MRAHLHISRTKLHHTTPPWAIAEPESPPHLFWNKRPSLQAKFDFLSGSLPGTLICRPHAGLLCVAFPPPDFVGLPLIICNNYIHAAIAAILSTLYLLTFTTLAHASGTQRLKETNYHDLAPIDAEQPLNIAKKYPSFTSTCQDHSTLAIFASLTTFTQPAPIAL
ncbi:hypothetical protein CC79DRAFT_1334899 [Sarocladium strictum]